jgi:hypothetical protein
VIPGSGFVNDEDRSSANNNEEADAATPASHAAGFLGTANISYDVHILVYDEPRPVRHAAITLVPKLTSAEPR